MKNAINYYYNLSPSVIHQTGKTYKFAVGGSSYILTPFDLVDEVKDIYELAVSLLQRGIPCHQIILNTSNQILTNISDTLYILMLISVDVNAVITLNDIIYFNNYSLINMEKSKLIRSDWFNLWTNKIDYFEYQVNQLGKKYPLIRESFGYFVGMAENAISLVKNNSNETRSLVVCHRRIRANDTLYDLYNPLNMIVDSRVRDVVEYFKSAFLSGSCDASLILNYLYYANLSDDEGVLFFARMIFPSFYFDIYEKVISNNGKEEEFERIIRLADDYEGLIMVLYQHFRSVMNFPEIEWLKKVTN